MKHHNGSPSHPRVEGHHAHKAGALQSTGITDIAPTMREGSPSFRGAHGAGGYHPFQQQSGHHDGTMDAMHSNHSDHAERVKKGHP